MLAGSAVALLGLMGQLTSDSNLLLPSPPAPIASLSSPYVTACVEHRVVIVDLVTWERVSLASSNSNDGNQMMDDGTINTLTYILLDDVIAQQPIRER